jgi:hypothetical protein
MNDLEAIIVYDTIHMIKQSAPILCKLLNERASEEQRHAYKSGVYAASIRLDALLTSEQRADQAARCAKIKAELDEYLATRDSLDNVKCGGAPAPCSSLRGLSGK